MEDLHALAEAARDESPPDLICPYALRLPAAEEAPPQAKEDTDHGPSMTPEGDPTDDLLIRLPPPALIT